MGDLFRDIFLAFVRVHILHHAAEEPIYGLWMIEELTRHGYEISPGTLYPILHDLERTGYLRSAPRLVGGKTRKYYRATDAGKEALARLRPKLRELMGEALKDPSEEEPVRERLE